MKSNKKENRLYYTALVHIIQYKPLDTSNLKRADIQWFSKVLFILVFSIECGFLCIHTYIFF